MMFVVFSSALEASDKETPSCLTYLLSAWKFSQGPFEGHLTEGICGIGSKVSPRAYQIPHLLFAYNNLLFCRTNLESCQELNNIIKLFCKKSGQLINCHKSSLAFSSNTITLIGKWYPSALILHISIISINTFVVLYSKVGQN